MPSVLRYARHELDPVLIFKRGALIYVNRHWQAMRDDLIPETTPMSKLEFVSEFGSIADVCDGPK